MLLHMQDKYNSGTRCFCHHAVPQKSLLLDHHFTSENKLTTCQCDYHTNADHLVVAVGLTGSEDPAHSTL